MQKILGFMRKACQEYDMIHSGDKIAAAVSGGKDSLIMLAALCEMKRFYPKEYEVAAVSVDMQFGGIPGNFDTAKKLCDKYGIEYRIISTDIAKIVFDIRKESNPCSLCASLRRGALYGAAEELGCNKLALGHNNDDVVETFLMCLFNEGRIGCFSPVTEIKPDGIRQGHSITVIRPLILAPETSIISACEREGIIPMTSPCPADKHTERQNIKEFISSKEHEHRGFKHRLFVALCKSAADGWAADGYKKEG